MPRAFRRPATAKEIDRYLGIFDKARQRGDPYDQSVKLALKGVLISPSFLFLIETPAEKKGAYRLDHYEVASHLSYFLWASMPDEKLLELASQGKLHDEEVLRGQVRRMIARPPRPRPGGRVRRAVARDPAARRRPSGPTPGRSRSSTTSWRRRCARRPSCSSTRSSARTAASWR